MIQSARLAGVVVDTVVIEIRLVDYAESILDPCTPVPDSFSFLIVQYFFVLWRTANYIVAARGKSDAAAPVAASSSSMESASS